MKLKRNCCKIIPVLLNCIPQLNKDLSEQKKAFDFQVLAAKDLILSDS